MQTYKDAIVKAMKNLAKEEKSVFLGQGLLSGDRIYGTLSQVPSKKCIEMPVAENLIMGTAIGLAMQGYKPIVIFQRMDFMLIAADQIINHAALIPHMSNHQFELPIIVRAIIGSQSTKFDVGDQHQHNFKHVFAPYIKTYCVQTPSDVSCIYNQCYRTSSINLVIEEKDLY